MNPTKPVSQNQIALIIVLMAAAFLIVKQFNTHTGTPDARAERLAKLHEMFADAAQKTKWNFKGNLLWGFFFNNPTKEPLIPLSKELEVQVYRVVNIYLDDPKERWWLHVQKIEIHTPESLYDREAELRSLIANRSSLVYDGWDVGFSPAPTPSMEPPSSAP
jgi:hypothetical protein